MSTFNGVSLFGSGPHRFLEGRRGQSLQSQLFASPPGPGTLYLGLVETRVRVRGRLVAASEAGLWALRDAVTAQLQDPPVYGTLADGRGRAWDSMSLVGFRVSDRVDRGRAFSVAYEATFIRLRSYP